MVHKIKNLKIIILLIVLITAIIFTTKTNIETNLLKALLPQSILAQTDIVPIADKYSSVIKIVFESDTQEQLENIKKVFISSLDKDFFELNEPKYSDLVENYLLNPTNFLSETDRKLLSEKRYDDIFLKSLEMLYNPAGIQVSSFENDPYLLLDDFLMANRKIKENEIFFDGKYHDFLTLKLKNQMGLSPDLYNKKVAELIKLQKHLENKSTKIYLAGTPIHSYYTSKKSMLDINLICIFSTLLIIALTYYYFKRIKILFVIGLSIIFGMLTGFILTNIIFNNFHMVTLIFATTLIGIGIDYSYHYCFVEKIDKTFFKNLTLSLFTTIIPFLILFFTKIEILQQISVFTVSGLSAIYLFILLFYPSFDFPAPEKTIKIPKNFYKYVFIILSILGIIGLTQYRTNDSLSSLYIPSKNMINAENLYNRVSGNALEHTQIITVKGENFEDLLEKEEKIAEKLYAQNIEYISISKFIPSKSRQEENFELVKQLYFTNLEKFSEILSLKQRKDLLNKNFTPVYFDIKNYSYLADFLFKQNSSFMIINFDGDLQINEPFADNFCIKKQTEKYLKDYRQTIERFSPIAVFVLILLFVGLYGLKRGIKILLPPFLGTVLSVGLTCLSGFGLNLFAVIALFLILGFTIDYSIFRAENTSQTEDAIFISSLTTSCSFLLLSFSGFRLLSSISLVLFWGILVSYISGYLLFQRKNTNSMIK